MTRDMGAALLAYGALLAVTAPTPVQPQGACTYAKSGYLTELSYQLPVTYLTPGVADWMVAVPLPIECASVGGQAVGQEVVACDHDTRPGVRAERGGLHVRRAGWLQGYATVQLAVFCMLPYPPPPLNTMLNVLPAQSNMLPVRPNALPAQPNMSLARPNVLPALPNRLQNVTELVLSSTTPRSQQLNDTVSSIATPSTPEMSSSSDEDEDEDFEVKPEDNLRLLQ